MLARIRSAAVLGIDAYPVDVEVDITNGLPSFSTVGLPQGAVKEGRERVGAALVNAGFSFPLRRITVNLARRTFARTVRRSTCPLPSASSLASGQLPEDRLRNQMVLGEVGLEGDLRPVRWCTLDGPRGAGGTSDRRCCCPMPTCPRRRSSRGSTCAEPIRCSRPAPTSLAS